MYIVQNGGDVVLAIIVDFCHLASSSLPAGNNSSSAKTTEITDFKSSVDDSSIRSTWTLLTGWCVLSL